MNTSLPPLPPLPPLILSFLFCWYFWFWFLRDRPGSEETNGGPRRSSKLAAFLSTNKAEKHIPTFEAGLGDEIYADNEDGGGGEERPCKFEGCMNRSVHNVDVCPMHTKRCPYFRCCQQPITMYIGYCVSSEERKKQPVPVICQTSKVQSRSRSCQNVHTAGSRRQYGQLFKVYTTSQVRSIQK